MADERNAAPAAEDTHTRTVTVGNPDGLHLRPITRFAQRAAAFPCAVSVRKGDTVADGKAMIQLLTLAAACGDAVTVRAVGPRAEEAVRELGDLIASAEPF